MIKKTTSLITQVRPAYFSVDCGMTYVIRVCDGQFVLIDSSTGEYEEADHLWDVLLSQCEGNEKPVIAAWFITHPHRDHFGGFVKFMEKYRDYVQLDSVVYSWASEEVCPRPAAPHDPADFERLLASFGDKVQIIAPHTGRNLCTRMRYSRCFLHGKTCIRKRFRT